MKHSGNSAVSNQKEGFIFFFTALFKFINKVIDSLTKAEHRLTTIIITSKLLFCFVKNSRMLFPLMSFIFPEVLFNKTWFN